MQLMNEHTCIGIAFYNETNVSSREVKKATSQSFVLVG